MRIHMKLGVIFFACVLVLLGCGRRVSSNEDNMATETDLQHRIVETPYIGYLQKEMGLSMYEPIRGTYLGAYVLSNPEIGYDIRKFEEAVDKDVAMELRYYQMGDLFPDKWLLECLANKKSPYIIISPKDLDLLYDKDLLDETAKKFRNTYSIPIFIEFYPGAKELGDAENYIDYFRLAKQAFNKYAPNAVLVWSSNMEDIYDSMIYYPGDEYVDWVGMNMFFPIYKDNERYNVDLDKHLDYFYNMYQDKKPMMISGLAVSHYSNKDHSFYLDEAEEIINKIYSKIPNHYPRIKGVNYIDFDNIRNYPSNVGNDNFRVSTEPKISQIYSDAIKGNDYLDSVEEAKERISYQWIKMRTPIYIYNNDLYILEDTLMYDWEIDVTRDIREHEVILGGERYYNLDQLVSVLGYKYTINKNILRIY